MNSRRQIVRNALAPLERFLHVEAASGIVLLCAAVFALGWANSPWSALYEQLWHTPLTLGIGDLVAAHSLHFWINDGLMTIFFLVVGLEIRREMHDGALSNVRLAALPAAAAAGGVIAPALIYTALNTDPALQQGWPVPTATDIAFAVGVLTLLGKRVPSGLRALLLALAIIDDIFAILVIAFLYSEGIAVSGLLIGAAGVVGILLFRNFGVRSAWTYALPGILLWVGLLRAGIHPTLAGVILGLLIPIRASVGQEHGLTAAQSALDELGERLHQGRHDAHALSPPDRALIRARLDLLPLVLRMEAALHPWVAFGIMPLFAFANAGVSLEGLSFSTQSLNLGMAIFLGLVVGKPLGVVLVTVLTVKLRLLRLPPGVDWQGVLLIGCLAGIGFTMSIFLAGLAFPAASQLATAKLAVLAASTCAALIGLTLGRLRG